MAQQVAAAQSRTTHAAPPAIEACQLFGELLRAALHGERDVIRLARKLGPRYPALRHLAGRNWTKVPRDEVSSAGYVVTTLDAAFWAIANTQSFEDAVILAVNLAGEANTVG